MSVCGVMLRCTAAVEVAVKRGNGKSQHSRQKPDRPVSFVTPTHASPSGSRMTTEEGEADQPGKVIALRQGASRVRTKAVKAITVCCGRALFILGSLKGTSWKS